MKLNFYFLITFICLLNLTCFSQGREFNFINYTQENGLPSNESYFIYRDSKNFLWIATDKGVVRYDGNKMENFDLPDNVIFKIREDSKGRIWFFSHTGKLAYFYNGTIYPYKYNENIVKYIKSILIIDAYVDKDDNIFMNSILSENYQISKSGEITKFKYINAQPDDSNRVVITAISATDYFTQNTNVLSNRIAAYAFTVKTASGVLNFKTPYFLNDLGQYRTITGNHKDFFFFIGNDMIKLNADGTFKNKKFSSKILSINFDGRGNVWIGLEKSGAVLLDADLDELYSPAALKYKSISSVTQDYEGGTWFSTLESGVYFLKNFDVGFLSLDSSLNKEVFRMYTTDNKALWYGKREGLFSITNTGKVSFLQTVKSTKISDIFYDKKGEIYVAGKIIESNRYLVTTIKKSAGHKLVLIISGSEIAKPFENKFVWNNGGYLTSLRINAVEKQRQFSVYSPEVQRTLHEPGIIFLDHGNQVWSGTINNLYKLNPNTDLPVPLNEPTGSFKKGVTCIRQMDNGIYTIGIRFGGIALLKDSGVIGKITEIDGLLSNSVKYLLPIKNQLWVATAKGVSVIQFLSYDPLKFTITNIGKNKGLYNLIINQLVQFNGSILAATSNGIYFIDRPQDILNEEPKTIPFYISTVSYYKGDTVNISSITVPYDKNRVIIKYTALCFNAHEDVIYYYRFDSNDTTWQTTKNPELLLENLSPGSYSIEIKAAIPNERRFSGIKKLQIIVEKPWWQNNWLRLAGILLILGAIYVFYRRRIHLVTRREKQNATLNARMLELEQMALRSQMNPHFIFNCLTSIQQLIISGNKTDANEYLVKFARLIRKTLELSANSFITIEDETSYLKEYLALEQLRIPGKFEFSIVIDGHINVHKTEIPGMMLQPIIENSIRHGIKHLENKNGQIDISLKQEGAYILCSITDNGVGRGKSGQSNGSSFRENKSYGMEIVTKRLSAMSLNQKNEGTLEVEDIFNTDGSAAGTKVTMLLPFKTKQS